MCSSLLDDVEAVRSMDKGGMLYIQERFPEQCEEAMRLAEEFTVPDEVEVFKGFKIRYKKPARCLVAGMGGSAIGGDLLCDWLYDRVSFPIETCRDYHLPRYADGDTLVFAVSYSGDTEEALSTFLEAVERGCMIFSVTSGGFLQKFSEAFKIPLVKVPKGLQPRAAIAYLLIPMAMVLSKLKAINYGSEFSEALNLLRVMRDEVKVETLTVNNPAKQLALNLFGTVPVVYGFRPYVSIALRMKTQFNENSKIPAMYASFPELNHNEVVGWRGPESLTKIFSIVVIRDHEEPLEVRERIEITKKLISKNVKKVLEVYVRGSSRLSKMLSSMYIGDMASSYLAILQGIDPTPVEAIEKLKEELAERVNVVQELERRMMKLLRL